MSTSKFSSVAGGATARSHCEGITSAARASARNTRTWAGIWFFPNTGAVITSPLTRVKTSMKSTNLPIVGGPSQDIGIRCKDEG